MHDIPPASWQRHGFNNYWRLHVIHDYSALPAYTLSSKLRQDGFSTMYGYDDLKMKDISRRMQCGGLAYEVCKSEELRRFLRDRRIMGAGESKFAMLLKDSALIDVLLEDDKTRTFPRFTEFPPEIRERITKFYLKEFAEGLQHPAQPPLARTCKLLRKETLPLFYQRCTFAIQLWRKDSGAQQLIPSNDTYAWLMNLRPEYVGKIRKLSLEINTKQKGRDRSTHVLLDLSVSRAGPSLQIQSYDYGKVDEETLEKLLQEVIKGITCREEVLKLTVDDLYTMRKAIESSIKT